MCEVPWCMNLQQGCSGSWCHTAAHSSLGSSCVGQSFFSDLGIAHTRVWPMVQKQSCPSEGQRGQLDEASRDPPSLHGQHHPGLCIPGSVRSSLHRLFCNKCTTLQHSCCFSPTSTEWWLQELAPLSTRCGCFHSCSTISCDHCFVQLIFVILT